MRFHSFLHLRGYYWQGVPGSSQVVYLRVHTLEYCLLGAVECYVPELNVQGAAISLYKDPGLKIFRLFGGAA